MTNDYEVDENGRVTIDISKILTGEVSIRKMAKKFGLRRDDLINRIKEAFKDDEEAINQLNFIVSMNKIIFDDLTIEAAAKDLGMSQNELDQKILATLMRNESKLNRYLDKKSGNTDKQNNRKNQGKIQKNKYNRESNNRRNKTISRSKEG